MFNLRLDAVGVGSEFEMVKFWASVSASNYKRSEHIYKHVTAPESVWSYEGFSLVLIVGCRDCCIKVSTHTHSPPRHVFSLTMFKQTSSERLTCSCCTC